MNKKTKATLLSSIMTLFVAAMMLVSATVAWFSMNKEVTSKGMFVTADVSPNVVIAKTLSELQAVKAYTAKDNISVDFDETDESANKLAPATHFVTGKTYAASATENLTQPDCNLVYVKNTSKVAFESGYAAGTNTLYYGEAENGEAGSTQYYKDYIVYIGSVDVKLDITKLVAKFSKTEPATLPSAEGSSLASAYNAISVDFYVKTGTTSDVTIAKTDYQKTLNLAELDYLNSGTAVTSADIYTGTGISVPHNTEGFIKVLMRVYIDGNLASNPATNTQAYVNSSVITFEEIGLKVEFEAVEPGNH